MDCLFPFILAFSFFFFELLLSIFLLFISLLKRFLLILNWDSIVSFLTEFFSSSCCILLIFFPRYIFLSELNLLEILSFIIFLSDFILFVEIVLSEYNLLKLLVFNKSELSYFLLLWELEVLILFFINEFFFELIFLELWLELLKFLLKFSSLISKFSIIL